MKEEDNVSDQIQVVSDKIESMKHELHDYTKTLMDEMAENLADKLGVSDKEKKAKEEAAKKAKKEKERAKNAQARKSALFGGEMDQLITNQVRNIFQIPRKKTLSKKWIATGKALKHLKFQIPKVRQWTYKILNSTLYKN